MPSGSQAKAETKGAVMSQPLTAGRDGHGRQFQNHAISGLALSIGAAFIFVIGEYASSILPAKYFYDSNNIAALAQGRGTLVPDRSYRDTAAVYRILHLATHPALVVAVNALLVLLLIAVVARSRIITTPGLGLGLLLVILGGVFLTQYSKDLLLVPVIILLIVYGNSAAGDITLLAVGGVYAYYFRSYWALVLVCYVLTRAILARFGYSRTSAGIAVMILIAIQCIGFRYLLHLPFDHYRLLDNQSRSTSADAATMIKVYVGGAGLFSQLCNAYVTVAAFVLPVPLLRAGGAVHAAFAIAIGSTWLGVLRRREYWACDRDRLKARALALLVAFTAVQSSFEPDYGSYARHLTPLIALMMIAVCDQRVIGYGVSYAPGAQHDNVLSSIPPTIESRAVRRREGGSDCRFCELPRPQD